MEFDISTATVAEAAEAVGVIPARIAKTLSFQSEECGCILVLMAGDAKVDNKKYRARFGVKPHMLTHEDALQYTGHAVGGVCPFAVPDSVPVYLDVSLKRFDTVFPAAGSAANSPAAITAAAARLAVRSFRVPFKIYSSFKVNIINYHHTTTA